MLQVARHFRIARKFKVERPYFETLRKDTSKIGTLDMSDADVDYDNDMKEFLQTIFEAGISEEQEEAD